MARIEKSIEIGVPIGKTFDFVTTWQNKLKYFEGVYGWEPTTDKTAGEGARFVYKTKSLGHEYEVEEEISKQVENEKFVLTSIRGLETETQFDFKPLENKTKITITLNYKVPFPVVGGLIDTLMAKPMWDTRIEKTLQNLKRLLES